MARNVLCVVLCGVLLPACGEDKGDSPLPSEGEGQGEGEGAEGEGPVAEGEGEGPVESEGEGEDTCVPSLEVCNSLDDDCDGETDDPDDLVAAGTIGRPCGTDDGECVMGIEECVDGAIVCSGEIGPTDHETCDILDNDCDGETDEEYDVGTPCVVGIGACQVEGLTRCSDDGERTECDVHPSNPAQTETCINGLDDDCDGSTDEGCACNTGTSRPCGDTDEGVCEFGQQLCDPDGRWGQCIGQVGQMEEACNALDDDCDGETDDTPTDVGEACAAGVGQCRREGVTQCQQGVEVCRAVVGQPSVEICNALDDDCDGETDDAPIDVGEACAIGVGQCRREGVTQCQQGVEACGVVAGQPAAFETCNYLDDDCDGETDESDFGSLLQRFYEDADGDGFGNRQSFIIACPVIVDGFQAPPAGYVSNNRDCDDTNARMAPGLPEVCDGLDNNCGFGVDETFRDLGRDCVTGIGGCQRQGVLTCNLAGDAADVCDAQPGDPVDEAPCDAVDNDCDGSLDEGASCIAFMSDREGGGIMIMTPDGSNPIHVGPVYRGGSMWHLAWSPTQPQIAFTDLRGAGDPNLVVLDLASGLERIIVAEDSREPSWAPDGQRLAFTKHFGFETGEIHVVEMANRRTTRITGFMDNLNSQPDFSPDGTQIAFVSLRNNSPKIFRIDADGRNLTRITMEAGEFGQPAWSPDGTKILYTYRDDIWDETDIWMMNRDGSNRRNLTNAREADYSPRWSPDGTKIVFETDRDGNDEIYVMDQDGGNPINLTQNPASDDSPDWSSVR